MASKSLRRQITARMHKLRMKRAIQQFVAGYSRPRIDLRISIDLDTTKFNEAMSALKENLMRLERIRSAGVTVAEATEAVAVLGPMHALAVASGAAPSAFAALVHAHRQSQKQLIYGVDFAKLKGSQGHITAQEFQARLRDIERAKNEASSQTDSQQTDRPGNAAA